MAPCGEVKYGITDNFISNRNLSESVHQHMMSSLEINEKDACLFVGKIPQQMTQVWNKSWLFEGFKFVNLQF